MDSQIVQILHLKPKFLIHGLPSAAWGPQPKQRTLFIRRFRRLADFTGSRKTFVEKQDSARL
jgi:hypothetical protein